MAQLQLDNCMHIDAFGSFFYPHEDFLENIYYRILYYNSNGDCMSAQRYIPGVGYIITVME